jgi:hypothetical protein
LDDVKPLSAAWLEELHAENKGVAYYTYCVQCNPLSVFFASAKLVGELKAANIPVKFKEKLP